MLPALLALAVAGFACAPAPVDDSELRLEIASDTLGGRFDYLIVESAGPSKDRAFITVSKATGPSKLSRNLAEQLMWASRKPVRIVVTGPNDEKTERVILGAFELLEGRSLPHLEFLYIGAPGSEHAVREAVSGTGGQFRFKPFDA